MCERGSKRHRCRTVPGLRRRLPSGRCSTFITAERDVAPCPVVANFPFAVGDTAVLQCCRERLVCDTAVPIASCPLAVCGSEYAPLDQQTLGKDTLLVEELAERVVLG